MARFISYENQNVVPKGLNPNNKINLEKLRSYFLNGDYEKLIKTPLPHFELKNIILLYPGCGVDIFTPLIYIEKLFQIKEAQLIFVDTEDILGMVKTSLDDVGISFSENNNKISFYWNSILINLKFIQADIFKLDLPYFNVYFERAFRIMKENINNYERNILEKLSPNGIIIADSGFEQLTNKTIIPELGSYGDLTIGKQ